MLVMRLDEQPVLLAAFVASLHVDEMPLAFELGALQLELEVAFRQLLVGITFGRPLPAVPHDDAAGAVFAFGDAPFELGVIERMILDVHRQALVIGRQARTPGHGPALQHAIELEAQVVMQPARSVLLDDEQMPTLAGEFAARLRGAREVALLCILAQSRRRHGSLVS